MAPTKSRGPELIGVAAAFLVLSWIFTILRVYCRAIVVRQVGSDDYLAFAAQVCFTMMCVSCFIGVHFGIGMKGVDIPDVLSGGAVNAVLWWWQTELWYLLASLLLKLSMGIFLLRIATARSVRWTIYTILLATIAATIYFFFHFVFQCRPVPYFWQRLGSSATAKGTCHSEDSILRSAYAYSTITCAVDFALCLVPVAMVARLQLNRRTKLSVMSVLSLWCLASVTTFIRIPYLSGLKGDKLNFLYNTADIGIWSLAETGISIMCIATATLRPLIAKSFFRSTYSDSRGTNTIGTYNQSRSLSRSGNHWGTPGSASVGRGTVGIPRAGYAKYGRSASGSGSKSMTIDEEIGQAMGSDCDSMEMAKRLGVAVPTDAYDARNHSHSRSYNDAMGMATTTYVRGGEAAKSVDEREGEGEGTREADFVYGYGIRKTTVITTQRE